MDKGYFYVDGNAVVQDYKGKLRLEKYTSNFHKILVLNNLIEVMKKEILLLEDEKQQICKRKKELKKLKSLSMLLSFFGLLVFPMLVLLIGHIDVVVAGFSDVQSLLASCLISLFSPVFISTLVFNFISYRKLIKREKGIESELSYLYETVYEQENVVNKMKVNANNLNSKKRVDNKYVSLNNKDNIKKLKALIKLYYDCGYNGDKYYRYYQRGILDNKLSCMYDEYDIDRVEECIEKKYVYSKHK